jgi:hypothetical protein
MDIPIILLVGATLVFIAASSIISTHKAKRKLRERLGRSWGKLPEGKYRPGDLESIASYFMNSRKNNPNQFFIDDITWHDLDMDDLFIRLNETETSAGEEVLYRLLREPSFNPEVLRNRREWIESLRNGGKERLNIQLILARMGKKRWLKVTDYFFSSEPPRRWKTALYRLLAAAAVAAPFTIVLHAGLGTLLVFLVCSINMLVYSKRKAEIEDDLAAFANIVGLVVCAGKILNADPAALRSGDLLSRLRQRYDRIRDIGRRGFFLFYIQTGTLMDLAYDVVRVILLKELIDYEYICRAVAERREDIRDAYDIVGLIDCLIAVASFRTGVSYYCEPHFVGLKPETPLKLEFDDIYHPLIQDPVPNSLEMDRSVLVTGSNASGKSTFLKTVAINAILAQSVHTCLARRYSSPLCTVLTSMALRDNMKNGESYFVVEIRSLKRILDSLNSDIPCLCMIDEVLRGTNTIERIAASSQMLLQLSGENCLCIAATHDIELTYILETRYRNLHFHESVTRDGIVFDYRLYEGRAVSRNAIKLLRLMGYGDEIVDEAEKRADRFMNRGFWTEN